MITPAGLKALADGDLENFMAASTPGGIEKQEAEGQKQFVASQTLPIKCPRDSLEKLGFKFGDLVDDIFIAVEMPKGWSKKPTDHSMWSDLIDSKGRKRGGIFYKAAFYDRNAHASLNTRYRVEGNYQLKLGKQSQYFVIDTATSEPVFSTKIINISDPKSYWDIDEGVAQQARDWLQENYPDHEDVLAYWD